MTVRPFTNVRPSQASTVQPTANSHGKTWITSFGLGRGGCHDHRPFVLFNDEEAAFGNGARGGGGGDTKVTNHIYQRGQEAIACKLRRTIPSALQSRRESDRSWAFATGSREVHRRDAEARTGQ